ncbi:MAG: SulP family inorganic anion transporter, partial [Gemmatimonadetes bacterium]|nr:SulP family inorganic anion transporter [Gemmatimonadota bacterium]
LGALAGFAAQGTPAYLGAAALLALVVGLTRIALAQLRAGVLAYIMSDAVVRGFVTGATLLIMLSQLPGALGVEGGSRGVIPEALSAATRPGAWEGAALVLAVMTVVLTLGARRVHPLIPGVLVSALIGLLFSLSTGYTGITVGAVPAGLPRWSLSLPWAALPQLLVPGVVIALIGFSEAASIARMYAAADRSAWDPNREFLSQGVANVVAGLSSGFPVGGSFGRSGVIRLAGGRTPAAGAVAGLIVLAFLPFMKVLASLPMAVLSAVVIAAVVPDLARASLLLRFWRMSRSQALVAWTTFALTLILAPHVEQAILVGILLALGVHLWRELEVPVRSWTEGDVVHLAPHGVLWFASAPGIESAFEGLLASAHGARRIVIHLGGLGRIDLTGALVLKEVLEEARAAGLEAELVEVPPHAHRILVSALGWSPPQS